VYKLRCFPSADEGFRQDAATGLSGLAGSDPHGQDGMPERLQVFLRHAYPEAVVIRAHVLATYTPEHILYVYRDGTPRPNTSKLPR
jgi:hypothetical protein